MSGYIHVLASSCAVVMVACNWTFLVQRARQCSRRPKVLNYSLYRFIFKF